ncbi:hypothetical protein ACFC3Z_13670 [Enterococcus thailandicus]|uniref:hypothetical protein n=1 Tax=Enterococcus thailandicus TaxID=417368 RepID=UPI0035DE8FB3
MKNMKKILSLGLICTSLLAASNFTTMNVQASETNGIVKTDVQQSKLGKSILNVYDRKIASIQAENDNWRVLTWRIMDPFEQGSLGMNYNYGKEKQKWNFFYDEESDTYRIQCGPVHLGNFIMYSYLAADENGHVSAAALNVDGKARKNEQWWLMKSGTATNGDQMILQNAATGDVLIYQDNPDEPGDFWLYTLSPTAVGFQNLYNGGFATFVIHVEGEF